MHEPPVDAQAGAASGFGPFGRGLLAVSKAAAVIGGLVFVAIVAMSIVSIVGRKLVSMPVPGDFELVEMGYIHHQRSRIAPACLAWVVPSARR